MQNCVRHWLKPVGSHVNTHTSVHTCLHTHVCTCVYTHMTHVYTTWHPTPCGAAHLLGPARAAQRAADTNRASHSKTKGHVQHTYNPSIWTWLNMYHRSRYGQPTISLMNVVMSIFNFNLFCPTSCSVFCLDPENPIFVVYVQTHVYRHTSRSACALSRSAVSCVSSASYLPVYRHVCRRVYRHVGGVSNTSYLHVFRAPTCVLAHIASCVRGCVRGCVRVCLSTVYSPPRCSLAKSSDSTSVAPAQLCHTV